MNRELSKAKFRAIGSGALVLVAVVAYVSFSAMMPSAANSLETIVEEQNISDFIVHVNQGNATDESTVASIPGVGAVDHRITVSSRLRYIDGDGIEQMIPATLVGIEPGRLPVINTLSIKDGDGGFFVGNGSGTVVLEGGFSYSNGIVPGNVVDVQTSVGYVEYSVAGLAFSPEHIMMPMNPQSVIPLPGSLAIVYMPIDSLRAAFGFSEDYVNEFLFLFDGTEDPDTTMSVITETLSSDTITFTQQRDELYGYALIKEDLSQGGGFTAIIAFLILLAAFFVTYSFFSRVVDQDRKQIGVLRALGYSRGSVMVSYLYMAVLIGLGGSVLGILIGVPFGQAFAAMYIDLMFHSETVELVLEPGVIIMGLLFGPVTTVLACAVAVRGTVSMEPHEAIKDMRTQKVRKHKKSAKSSFRASRLSYITIYTLRNTFRHKRRTTFTVVAVAFSVVLGAMSFLMVGSFANSLSNSITDHEKWDLVVDYSYPLNTTTADSISASGIDYRVQISRLAVVWYDGSVSEQGMVTGLPHDQTLHDFAVTEGVAAQTSDEVMIGYATSNNYGISPGDTIVLETYSASVSLTVSGILSDTVGEIVVFMDVMEELTSDPVFVGMYIKCEPGTAVAVAAELETLSFVANAQERDEIKSGLVGFMQSYNTVLYAFSLVGVTISTLTIANVVFMGVIERQREYGQLRAIGYTRRDTSKSIVVEILVMISLGSIVAVPLVVLVLESMVDAFREFWPTYSTVLYLQDWFGYGVVVLLTLSFGLLAAVPGIRFLNKIDLAKSVSGGRFG